MPGGSRDVGPLGQEVAARLRDAKDEIGVSLRTLAGPLSMSFTQLGRMLAAERVMTIDEVGDVALALGLRASEVIREAEAAVAARQQDGAVVVTDSAQSTANRSEAPVVRLGAGRRVLGHEGDLARVAAKTDPTSRREVYERTGWRDDLGEEPQDVPGWEE